MGYLFHRGAGFYDLFDELAAKAVSSASHLRTLAGGFPATADEINRIHLLEHEADDANHRVLDHLNHAFMPPIDAADVHALAGELDEIVDTVDAIAKRFGSYHIDAVDPLFVKQADVLVEAVARVSEAVHQLPRTLGLADLTPTLAEIHRLESVGDENHHTALSALFSGRTAPLEVMKWKELHGLVDRAIDGCEDVGNTLERITLKHA